MNILMSEGWFPILFIGIISAIGILIMSFKVTRTDLFITSSILNLICISLFFYSLTDIKSWKDFAVGFITISSLIGIWIGTIIGMLIKK
ncbi:MAG TPA: sodium:dicarboxylate symporter [Tissierellia bacterium]|nr:sodium:dicarboxylate symporter [Tissierellia bacterium]